MQCNAKLRGTDKRCRKHAIKGREKCGLHGGKQKRGPEHHRYKDGRFSKDAPYRIRARMSDLEREDPKLMELREEILLSEARTAELLSKIDIGETGELWKKLRKVHNEFLEYLRTGDEDKSKQSLSLVTSLIDKGSSDSETWDEINNQVMQGVGIKNTFFNMHVKYEHLVTTKQLLSFIADLADRIGVVVSGLSIEKELQQKIGREIGELVRISFPESISGDDKSDNDNTPPNGHRRD